MFEYFLTVFDQTGNTIFSDQFSAETDTVAKEIGTQKLKEHQFENNTHRLTRSGKLLLFHS